MRCRHRAFAKCKAPWRLQRRLLVAVDADRQNSLHVFFILAANKGHSQESTISEAASSLANAFVVSRLACCNYLYEFKLCATVFKALHEIAQAYISELCIPESLNDSQPAIGSSSAPVVDRHVKPMRYQNIKFGNRAICVAGPVPVHFKFTTTLDLLERELKIFLF